MARERARGSGPLVLLLLLAALLGPSAAANAAQITEFSAGISPGSGPADITAGADGNLWFTEERGGRVARITPGGQVTEFSQGISPDSAPHGIDLGPSGNVWFTEFSGGSAGRISRITPSGAVTGFSAGLSPFGFPRDIATGPDGNLWFTQPLIDRVGRITPDGQITEFSDGITPGSLPVGIARGPGGIWFTENSGDRIGRITPDGKVTEFSAGITPGSRPLHLTPGPDGNVWFTEEADRIGRITPEGKVTEFSEGITPGSHPTHITEGPDGNLWFTEDAGNRIARITPSGEVTEYSEGISPGSRPADITAGPNRTLWFTEGGGDRIGRVTLPDHYKVEAKAWIPFPHVVDPLRPFSLPYLLSLERNCANPGLRAPLARVSSAYRGDLHRAYEGSARVQSSAEFDWDGRQISDLRHSGDYGPTHRDLIYNWPRGGRTCAIDTRKATSATAASKLSGTAFRLSFSSKNPLTPQALTPPIDSLAGGIVSADGSLRLSYATDLFPSHGIQITRNGQPARTEVVGDISCLGREGVRGLSGIAFGSWGLTHQDNVGSITLAPNESGSLREGPSPLCRLKLWIARIPGFASAGSGVIGAREAARRGRRGRAISVAPVKRGGKRGRYRPLADAIATGLVSGVQAGGQTILTSSAAEPVAIKIRGRRVPIQVTGAIAGGREDTRLYSSRGRGRLVVVAGERVRVRSRGRRVASRPPDRAPPRTRAKVRVRGRIAIVRFRARDRSGVRRTLVRVAGKRVRLRRGRLRIPVRRLSKVRFGSVDLFGNAERARRLHRRRSGSWR